MNEFLTGVINVIKVNLYTLFFVTIFGMGAHADDQVEDPLNAGATQPWQLRQPQAVMDYYVHPDGNDKNPGTKAKPFRTLSRAQEAVRSVNKEHPVDVFIAGGTYVIDKPLRFTAADGGQDGRPVRWRALEGESPVISGGVRVDSWRLQDKKKNIYVADTPRGLQARQIWVDDNLALPARVEMPRDAVSFDEAGFVINDHNFDFIAKVAKPEYLELEAIGAFTNRISPVDKIAGDKFIMEQPAWKNNNWGYDTIYSPLVLGGERGHLYISNALEFVDDPGEWYLDSNAGKLYFIPPRGRDVSEVNVILPRLDHLIAISGTEDQAVRDLVFKGFRFSYTSWLGPSSSEGYANQQTGAYLTGDYEAYPDDALVNCAWGCREFEKTRNKWSQIPAAVQISAAERINFEGNVFAHLGQVALGIGNDSNTHASGIGLAAQGIIVRQNLFTDLAGGAILIGGIRPDAHHPSNDAMVNSHIIVQNNRIKEVAKQYRENAAILSTYVDGAIIINNEISDAPYDAIGIGWGWGINDVGGNPGYRFTIGGDIGAFEGVIRGHYDHPENRIFYTPTTLRNTIVANNRIHDVKQVFTDGGAIYLLSSNPGSFVYGNYLYNIPDRIGIYLDEGAKGITVHHNVVDGAGRWLNANTMGMQAPFRMTYNNEAFHNWHNTNTTFGWSEYGDNKLYDDIPVEGNEWPESARKVMENAGIKASVTVKDQP